VTQLRAYAGIGSRETPEAHLRTMRAWGRRLAADGWTLRSGAADGADSAFEAGALEAGGKTDIWLPWDGFNGHLTGLSADRVGLFGKACRIAEQHHPGWHRLGSGPRALMARNVFQVLGRDLRSPVRFVLCWALKPRYDQDGRIVDVNGGTGLAVRLAASEGIPVCHLDYHLSMRQLEQILEQAGEPTF
jgi:hypothetical protein